MNETPEDGPPASPYSEPSEAAGPSEEPLFARPVQVDGDCPSSPPRGPRPSPKSGPEPIAAPGTGPSPKRGGAPGAASGGWPWPRRAWPRPWPRATGCCWTRQLPAGRVGEASSSSASRTRAFWPSNAWPLARATSCASRPGFCTSVRTRPGCSATTEPSLSTRATTAPCHSRPWLGGRGSATGRRGG